MFVLWSAGVNLVLWQTSGHSNQSHRWLQPDTVMITHACHLSPGGFCFFSLTFHSPCLLLVTAERLLEFCLYLLCIFIKMLPAAVLTTPSNAIVLAPHFLSPLSSLSVARTRTRRHMTVRTCREELEGVLVFACSK